MFYRAFAVSFSLSNKVEDPTWTEEIFVILNCIRIKVEISTEQSN